MRDTQLVLIEGMPGSGKSTAAQLLARQMATEGRHATWWYEEVADHPLYVFHNRETLQQVVAALFSGEHRSVVTAVLEKWRAFAAALRSSGEIAVIDGCLFGYLTWSLFPADVATEEIREYIAEVACMIAPLRPCVIYLRQDDVAGSLRRICERRGGRSEEAFITRATENPYARRHGLKGFDGLVRYWTDYRALMDEFFAWLPFGGLAVESVSSDWDAHERAMLAYLTLPPAVAAPIDTDSIARLAGVYTSADMPDRTVCRVLLEGDVLVVDGLPHVWSRTPLLPRGNEIFEVASLPIEVVFRRDGTSAKSWRMEVAGPELLAGPVHGVYVRAHPNA